jgi:cation diffusion facilitator family transporter
MSTGESKRAIVAALLANLGIAVFKFIAFLFTGSSSMLAEGVHSLADTGNQVLLIVGGKKAQRAPDADHPFGFGRERYFWAFVVSIILFSLGSLFAIFEAVEKILHPEHIDSPAWAFGTLGAAIVLEANSFRTAIRESKHLKGSSTWAQFIRRSKTPELPVVLLEDAGALFGLVVALAAIAIGILTDNPRWDGIGTLAIGLLLGAIAIVLSVEMKSLLIGEAADPDEEARISSAIESSPLVRSLIYLRTQHFGPEQLLVTAKIEFNDDLSMVELAEAIDSVEVAIREKVPAAHYLFIEPDVRRAVANATAAPAAADGATRDAALDD